MNASRILAFILLLSARGYAQDIAGNQIIAAGQGFLTGEQLFDGVAIGIFAPTLKQYQYEHTTGISFINYKYFLGKRVMLGVTAGIEKESGKWLYNYYDNIDEIWDTYTIGTFSRTAYTIAPEFTYSYFTRKTVRWFTTVGLGATFKNETDVYDTAKYGGSNYHGGSLTQNVRAWRLPVYVAPIGVSAKAGEHLEINAELGIGYKGIFNCGLGYRFSTLAGRFRGVPMPSADAPVLLPADYPPDTGLVFLENDRVGRVRRINDLDFSKKLNRLSAAMQADGVNVLRIDRVKTSGTDVSIVRGEGYYAKDYKGFKKKVEDSRDSVFKKESCAFLIIYRIERGSGKTRFRINGKEGKLRVHSKYVIKITDENKYKIAAGDGELEIDVKPGQYYYIKAFGAARRSQVSIVDNVQGELESSLARTKKDDIFAP